MHVSWSPAGLVYAALRELLHVVIREAYLLLLASSIFEINLLETSDCSFVVRSCRAAVVIETARIKTSIDSVGLRSERLGERVKVLATGRDPRQSDRIFDIAGKCRQFFERTGSFRRNTNLRYV